MDLFNDLQQLNWAQKCSDVIASFLEADKLLWKTSWEGQLAPAFQGHTAHIHDTMSERKTWEKMCLLQTLILRCNGRWCHPAQQQVLYFSVLTLGQTTWEGTIVQNLAYAEKRWEQCKPHGKQTYSCSLEERMKVNCNYIKQIFPLSHSCHIVWLQKEALKKQQKLCLERPPDFFLLYWLLSAVFVSQEQPERGA